MKKKLVFLLSVVALAGVVSCKKEGCTDPDATNYVKKAKKDDGSCVYDPNVVTQTITENINAPTTIEGKTVKICGDIHVKSDLTILPGATIIMCAGASIYVETTGSLNCTGTAEKPIIIRGETQTKGFWEGLSFASNNPNNKLIYTTVKDAGTYWGWEYANVFVGNNAKLEISNSTISNSDNTGLYFSGTSSITNFSNNTFSNNTIVGLSLPAKLVGKLDGASSYNVSNGVNYIYARGGSSGSGQLDIDMTWPVTTTPCLLTDVLKINAGLVLAPGVTIVMEAGSSFDVTTSGYLTSLGTATNPIVIKGKSTAPGYWDGIDINSNNTNNKMAYTTVSDGGSYWAYEYSNIFVSGRLEINNSTVTNANNWGIYATSTAIIYTSGSVQTTPAGVEANNSLAGNGMGSSANCTDGCTIKFN